MQTEEVNRYKLMVVAGGATWVGVQETVPPGPDLVLFNSLINKTTLALPVTEISVAAVRQKVIASDQQFANRPIRVPRSVLVHIVDKLRGLQEEIQKLMEEKE